jgi:hypothetical protein
VDPAEDDLDAALPVRPSDLVAAPGGLAVDADGAKIDVLHVALDVERAHDVVRVDHLVARGRQRGEDAEAEAGQISGVLTGRRDELDLHGVAGGPPLAADRRGA